MTDATDLTSVERAGYVLAHIKDSGGAYRFVLTDADALLDAWTNGRAFFVGTSTYGTPAAVKLAHVEGVTVWTPDACAQSERLAAEERARDRQRTMIEGEP